MRYGWHISRLSLLLLTVSFRLASCIKAATKRIHGVTIYNWDKAFTNAGTMDKDGKKQEWLLAMRGGDKVIKKFCGESKDACLAEGHPDGGGVPFTAVLATFEELETVVKKHASDIEFIEPALPVMIEPPKGEGVAQEEAPIQPFGSSKTPDGELPFFLQTEQGAGFYVICLGKDHKTVGWGPFKTYNEADNFFGGKVQSCNGLCLTSASQFQCQRADGHHHDSRIKTWWTCKTTGQGNCQPGPTPAPPGNPFPPRRRRAGPGPPPPGGGNTNRWGLDRIDQRTGRDTNFNPPKNLDGKGVHVYVLDSGIRATHEDFTGRAVPTLDTSDYKTTKEVKVCDSDDMSCATDTYGHGSHCSGTIGGKVSGVATGATLHAVKVLKGRSDGSTMQILLGIDWVAKNGIRPALMSMSLGGDGVSSMMNFSISRAYSQGILSVVAAGNIGNGNVRDGQACSQTPAHVELAYTVSASTTSDARASYSNFGKCADIYAPGSGILSSCHRNDNNYCVMSGTSMATPHVSGAAALMLQKYPNAQPADLVQALDKYATPDVVQNPGAGTPNLLLYVTDYELNVKPPQPPPREARRRRRAPSRRRRGTSRRRSTRRRSPKRRRRASTRRRSTRRRGSKPPPPNAQPGSKPLPEPKPPKPR